MSDYKTETQKFEERYGELELEQSSWVEHWKDIRSNELPYRGLFAGEKPNDGTKRHEDLVDPTSLLGLRTLGAGMVGGLTSPSRPWFRLKLQDDDLNKRAAVREWLRIVETKMYGVYSQSNFYSSVQSTYVEEGGFGTACLPQLENWDRYIHFMPLTIGTYLLGTDEFGLVDTLYRTVWTTARNVVRRFGKDKCSDTIKKLAENAQASWVEIRHAVEPNDDRDIDKLDSGNKPWVSVYWVKGEDKLLSKRGFDEFMAPSPRWDLSCGIYGWGPGMDVLASQKMMHEMDLGSLEAQQKELDPPTMQPSGFKNRLITTPGGRNYFDEKNKEQTRRLYDFKFDYQGTIGLLDRKQRQTLQLLYYDLFLMLANEADRQKTATEVVQLHEEKLIQLGPVIDRQFHELLDPTISRTFGILLKRNALPPWPEELDQAEMKVEYISMLAQAQQMVGTKSMHAYTGFIAGLADMQIAAQREPTALDRLDIDAAAEEYGDMSGVTPSVVVPVDKANEIRQLRAQAQQQAAQQAQMANDAAVAKDLSATSTEGKNALTDLQRTMGGA